MKKKTGFYKYNGFEALCSVKLNNKKMKSYVQVWVWPDRKTYLKATWGNKAKTKKNKYWYHTRSQACFMSKSKKGEEWIGDLHFYKGNISIDFISHETSHAATQFFHLRRWRLCGRNEELYASFVGQISGVITAWLLEHKLKIKLK